MLLFCVLCLGDGRLTPTATPAPKTNLIGWYRRSDGLCGQTIELKPGGVLRSLVSTDTGAGWEEAGKWTLKGDRLEWRIYGGKEDLMRESDEIVACGQRVYLVKSDLTAQFIASLTERLSGDASRYRFDFILTKIDRASGEGLPADGRPNIPRQFSGLYVKEPVQVRVVSVGPGDLVRLKTGRPSHLAKGLDLWRVRSRDKDVEITDVEPGFANAEMVDRPGPKVGDRYTPADR